MNHLLAQIGRRPAPRGVSLLEVLISIGVIAVGLLGVIALIPVGGHLASRGLLNDAKSRVGRNAHREFQLREMGRPERWRWVTASGTSTPNPLTDTTTQNFVDLRSFAIDPLFVAVNGGTPVGGPPANQPQLFPYDSTVPATSGLVALRRLTLTNGDSNTVLTAAAAAEWFVSRDDLVFEAPTDRSLPPVPNDDTGLPWLDVGNGAASTPTRRQYEGRLSWFATLVPQRGLTNSYVLSVVVVHNRAIPNLSDAATAPHREAERVVGIRFTGQGFAGGEAELRALTAASDLAVQRGDWIMVSGLQPRLEPPYPATPPNPGTTQWRQMMTHRWYEVRSVDPDTVTTGTAPNQVTTRNVTLFGPDWEFNVTNPTASAPTPDTFQATLVAGVVAVYEKTIRLETSSLWTR